MKFTDDEIAMLHDILSDVASDIHHGTDGRTEGDHKTIFTLADMVFTEAKSRRLWWAMH